MNSESWKLLLRAAVAVVLLGAFCVGTWARRGGSSVTPPTPTAVKDAPPNCNGK